MNYQTADLSNLFIKRPYRRERVSSFDRSGLNDDRIHIASGQTKEFACIEGPAAITHFWCTYGNIANGDTSGSVGHEPYNLRKIVLLVYWDDEEEPSVEVPLGDFFGMGHGICKAYNSAPLQMTAEDGHGCNCWFPMPFRKKARFQVRNECHNETVFYFYLDYEKVDELPKDSLYFHAVWHREMPTEGKDEKEHASHTQWIFGSEEDKNLDGKGNYVILEAEGNGQYVGCNLNIVNCNTSDNWDWYGEGDDMIFIDGEPWPPRLHGTGMEDYFNCAWSPTQSFESPYYGCLIDTNNHFKGKATYYRYHIQDPIMFEKSIKVTIEHGQNNLRSDDYSSTAYWYQTEPHHRIPKLPPLEERLPVDEKALWWKNIIKTVDDSDKVK